MSYFEESPIVEADSFERQDTTQHKAYLTKLVQSWKTGAQDKVAIGQATVMTGELQENGRGKEEVKDERAFRKLAGEMNVGLRVTHRHLPDGKTVLRLSPQVKKTFSDEAIAKRTAALEKRRERIAVERFAKDHNKLVTQLTRDEAQGAIAAYRAAKANGQTTSSTPAKAAAKKTTS